MAQRVSIRCFRCRGLMRAEEFQDWHGGMGVDRFIALRCLLCGDIVDAVILQNRSNTAAERLRSPQSRVRHNAPVLAVGMKPR